MTLRSIPGGVADRYPVVEHRPFAAEVERLARVREPHGADALNIACCSSSRVKRAFVVEAQYAAYHYRARLAGPRHPASTAANVALGRMIASTRAGSGR